jgi:hypothetical protein
MMTVIFIATLLLNLVTLIVSGALMRRVVWRA